MGTILPVVVICAVVLIAAYFIYGRLLMRWLGVDPDRKTPAVQYDDGVDFVPAPAPVVLGGHFTAIAAAGPIVGPIVAGLLFGWLPALLWIMLGAILIGGVHDAGSLLASIRHKASSITQIVREHMSRSAYLLFLIFVWFALVFVIIAFADVTAGAFSKLTQFTVPVDGTPTHFKINGGAVAVGGAAYLLFSIVLGLVLRFTPIHWSIATAACVIGLGFCIYFANDMALALANAGLGFMNTETATGTAGERGKAWGLWILGYCFVASIVPMWLLLQPRGVIGAMFLYASLAFGIVGALIGGLLADPSVAISWPAFKGFTAENGALLFPILFITIACGACSGFHAVVSSGTTCKQVKSERHIKVIGYGAMLMEAMVAVFALTCVMVMLPGQKGTPDEVYARGLGNFMRLCGIDMTFAVGFALLAFSSFIFDTLDVCTRLGRYVLQELLGVKGMVAGAIATLITVGGPAAYLIGSAPGSFKTFWTLFGTSNQLLAALTLVGVSVWLWRTGRPVWFALAPALFMLVTTLTALVVNIRGFWMTLGPEASQNLLPIINISIATLLLGLSAFVAVEAFRVWWKNRCQPVTNTSFAVVSERDNS